VLFQLSYVPSVSTLVPAHSATPRRLRKALLATLASSVVVGGRETTVQLGDLWLVVGDERHGKAEEHPAHREPEDASGKTGRREAPVPGTRSPAPTPVQGEDHRDQRDEHPEER